MDWVSDQIAIGSFVDALVVVPGEVDAILCLKENCCNETDARFDICCISLTDGIGNDPHLVERAVDFINATISSGRRVLVHCHAGRSRSVCIIARYLAIQEHYSPEQAIARIRRVRDVALSPGITDILNA